jgi:hypothetical protein
MRESWLLVVLAVIAGLVSSALVAIRPVLTSQGSGGGAAFPKSMIITPGDGMLTVSWASSDDGTARYWADAVIEGDVTPAQMCQPVNAVSPGTATCILTRLTNGFRYLVSLRDPRDSPLAAPLLTVRGIPRPAILKSADIASWLDASDLGAIQAARPGPARVGSTVVALRDKSPHHQDAVQPEAVREPVVGQLSNLPALLMNGEDYLGLADTAFPLGRQPATVLAVAAQDDPAPESKCWHNLLSWGVTQTGKARIVYKGCYTSLAFAETFGTADKQKPTKGWPVGEAAVLTAVFDGAGTSVRLNGAFSYRWVALPGQQMNTAGQAGVMLGAAPFNLEAGWVGRIGEVIVIDRLLRPEEVRSVERYLAGKWNLKLAPS